MKRTPPALLALAVMAAFAAPISSKALMPAPGTEYVANQSSNTVTPITIATNTAGTPIAVSSDPRSIAITPTPDLAVACTPVNPPIVIPAAGGRFRYDLEVHNNTATSITKDLWFVIEGPSGGPTVGPFTISIPAMSSFTRRIRQKVPGNAPGGDYTHTCNVGNFDDGMVDASDFLVWNKQFGLDSRQRIVADWSAASEIVAELEGSPSAAVASEYRLNAAYPNPFNPTTLLSFDMPESAIATLVVYDAVGREVARLVEGRLEAGRHEVSFDASNLPSGGYFARFTAGNDFAQTQRLTLLK